MSSQQDAVPAAGDADPDTTASHSGRLLVRMPGTLHAELAREADREGVSLNSFIVAALSGAVGWRGDPAARPGGAAVPAATGAAGPVTAGAAGAVTAGATAPTTAGAAGPVSAVPVGGGTAAAAPAPLTAVPGQPVVLAPAAAQASRTLSLALAVNLVVVVLAAAAAVVLLIAAWPG
jgi:2-oxoisovalerate dehydrogenase E2 component (dihydrolipoyl transacylase)